MKKSNVMFDELNIKKKYSLVVVLMLIILAIIVYWPVQNYEFINFDDDVYITTNRHIQSGITLDELKWAFSTKHFDLWTPLVYLSFMFDYQLFLFNAGGYHWTNVIIHILNSILWFFLFRNLTGSIWRSAFVAALFAIHPMNVESVAWIAERKNVLSTLFWTLTMLCYVWYVKKPNWKRYLLVLVSFALGLMSKPMLVTLPFVLLLIDYWPLNRTAINTQQDITTEVPINAEKEKLSFLVLEKVPLLILSVMLTAASVNAPQTMTIVADNFMQRLHNVIFSYAMYLKKLFWPTDLSIYYLYLNIPTSQILLSALLLIMITFCVCKYLKKYPYLPVGWFWYLGTLVPVIGIMPIGDHTMADRYAYVPFIGVFVMIAWGAGQISSQGISLKKVFIFAFALMILFFTAATHKQIKLWANTSTLFEDALRKDPNNFLASHLLGDEMQRKKENAKALAYYDNALKVNYKFYPTYYNKGELLIKMGKREEAFINFKKAIEMNQLFFAPYYAVGFFYLEENNLDQSLAYFKKVIELKPDFVEAYNGVGTVLFKKEKIEESIEYFKKALQIDPNNRTAQKNLKIAHKLTENLNKK